MGISQYDPAAAGRLAWNAGKQVGAKRALKIKQIWSIRFFLDREGRMRDRALFDLAIDSKLRGCDLVKIKIGTLVSGPAIRFRSMVIQQKTGRPVQFEITADTRASLLAWLERRGGTVDDFAFPSHVSADGHLSTRQYARLVDEWVTAIGLPAAEYGTHSSRRTKASIIYKATGTCEPSRSCSVTARSRTQSDISGWMLTTHSPYRSLPRSNPSDFAGACYCAVGEAPHIGRSDRNFIFPKATLPL